MNIYNVAQTVLAILIIISILMQSRGAGLGSAWGGEGQMYGTRRGVEKLLLKATIFFTVLFILISLLALLV